ncbi:hypothetical protein [Armatimonas sp.]|uniref:hypothetical protein n=1 Tax=Armatimonas sp. TaxID=1872638 RepID=UPI0037510702
MKLINRVALIYLGIAIPLGGFSVYQSAEAKQRTDLAWVWQGEAQQLQRQRQWQAAEWAWKRALYYEKPKSRGHLFLSLAALHQRQEQNQKAMDCYQKALLYEIGREQRADAHLQLGDLLDKKGESAAAVPHWQEAARLTPTGMPLMAAGYTVHKEAEARLTKVK